MIADIAKNLGALKLRENMLVADLGAGSGFYTIPLARILANGKVYAVEVQKDFLETIKNKAEEEHLENIEYIWGNVEKLGGTKLKDGILDKVIASNIFFQIEDKENFIKEIKRILKPGGQLLLIDWADSSSPFITSGHKIVSKEEEKRMFLELGFEYFEEISTMDHHYGIIFNK